MQKMSHFKASMYSPAKNYYKKLVYNNWETSMDANMKTSNLF